MMQEVARRVGSDLANLQLLIVLIFDMFPERTRNLKLDLPSLEHACAAVSRLPPPEQPDVNQHTLTTRSSKCVLHPWLTFPFAAETSLSWI